VGERQQDADLPLFMTLSSTKDGLEFAKSDMPVVEAVRASSALPFAFKPVSVKADNATDATSAARAAGAAEVNTWIDGGLLQNLPVALYEKARDEDSKLPGAVLALQLEPDKSAASGGHQRAGFIALGLVLVVASYWFLQSRDLWPTQSQAAQVYYGILLKRSLLHIGFAAGVALLARGLFAKLLPLGMLRTAGNVLSAVAAQNETKLIADLKQKEQLIVIETGSIGTYDLSLNDHQRAFLILSGAIRALEYVKRATQRDAEIPTLPLPLSYKPPTSVKDLNDKRDLARKNMNGVRIGKMVRHMLAGAAAVLLAALGLVFSLHAALYERKHHIGGDLSPIDGGAPVDGGAPRMVVVTREAIAAYCSAGDAGASDASSRFLAACESECSCDAHCTCAEICVSAAERVNDAGMAEDGGANKCYSHASAAFSLSGTDIDECFSVGTRSLSADVVETLCWVHFRKEGTECLNEAKQKLTADAARDCLAAFALTQQGWRK